MVGLLRMDPVEETINAITRIRNHYLKELRNKARSVKSIRMGEIEKYIMWADEYAQKVLHRAVKSVATKYIEGDFKGLDRYTRPLFSYLEAYLLKANPGPDKQILHYMRDTAGQIRAEVLKLARILGIDLPKF